MIFVFIEITLFLMTSSLIMGEINDFDVEKLVLTPEELANFVLTQVTKNTDPLQRRQITNHPYSLTSSELTTELSDDESVMRTRKVWSRWGKWSGCSVTCGSGVMSRQRLCVEGRCAPGEKERQCRPCARSPCRKDRPLTDDTHESD